jgi:hypothetical protein
VQGRGRHTTAVSAVPGLPQLRVTTCQFTSAVAAT